MAEAKLLSSDDLAHYVEGFCVLLNHPDPTFRTQGRELLTCLLQNGRWVEDLERPRVIAVPAAEP